MIGKQLDTTVIPDQINAVVGWRAWRVRDNKLCSITQKYFWYPHEIADANTWVLPRDIAKRMKQERGYVISVDDKPITGLFPDYSHGIYAWKTRLQAKSYGINIIPFYRGIIGEIYLWGRVFEHKDGYRAEFAYPKSFLVRGPFSYFRAKRLMKAYGVKELKYSFPFQDFFTLVLFKPKELPRTFLRHWGRIFFFVWVPMLIWSYHNTLFGWMGF